MPETSKIDIPHKLTREAARARIEQSFAKLRDQALGGFVKFDDVWTDDRLDFRAKMLGQTVVGRLDVLENSVHVEMDLPTLLAALAGKIKGQIAKGGQVLLEKK